MGESHISILLTNAYGDSGWVLNLHLLTVDYGRHRWEGLVN